MANSYTITTALKAHKSAKKQLPKFIKKLGENYLINKPITKHEIISFAKYLISLDLYRIETLGSSRICKNFLILNLARIENEFFCALFLDAQNRVIAFEKLFQGSINTATVYPREIVRKSLHYNSSKLIFAHNHPSGNCAPSHADIEITKKLKLAFAELDIEILDHIIVAGNSALSFADEGLL